MLRWIGFMWIAGEAITGLLGLAILVMFFVFISRWSSGHEIDPNEYRHLIVLAGSRCDGASKLQQAIEHGGHQVVNRDYEKVVAMLGGQKPDTRRPAPIRVAGNCTSTEAAALTQAWESARPSR